MYQRNFLVFLLTILLLADSSNSKSAPEASDPTEVVILSVLHQIHAEIEYYSFTELQKAIEKLQPTMLVLELTPTDLVERKEQSVKQEYQKAIFPLLEQHHYKAIAMEPAEPLYSELVNLHRESIQEAMASDSAKVTAFSDYTSTLIESLKKIWDSPASVNSQYTDKLFAAKHLLQDEVFGSKGADVWNRWNMHFLNIIKEAAKLEKGARVVVIVGAEHSYWLRKKLQTEKEIRLLDTQSLLR